MKKKIKALFCVIIFTITIFCGCQSSQVDNLYLDVFESEVVKLVNYSMNFKKNREGEITKVFVNGRIENILNEMITIRITSEFYDKNNEFLGEASYKIFNLRAKQKAGSSTTFNIIYDGNNVDKVNHIKLRAEKTEGYN